VRVTRDSVLLLGLPIAAQPNRSLSRIQGYFFNGGKVVLSPTDEADQMFSLIEKHG